MSHIDINHVLFKLQYLTLYTTCYMTDQHLWCSVMMVDGSFDYASDDVHGKSQVFAVTTNPEFWMSHEYCWHTRQDRWLKITSGDGLSGTISHI